MMENVKINHPYRKDGKQFSCGDVFCNTTPGNHRLLSSSEKGDFDIFGVGIVLYFKFMKLMILLFFLFTLFSIPAYLFYISGYLYNASSTASMTYGDGLTATTLAGVGYGTLLCGKSQYIAAGSAISLNCTAGVIADFSFLSYGLTNSDSTCELMTSVKKITYLKL
jgi:hypothetical protein